VVHANLDIAARNIGQISLFGIEDTPAPAVDRPTLPAPAKSQTLRWEKEGLGIYVSGHPMDEMRAEFERRRAARVRDLSSVREDQQVLTGGLVTAIRRFITKAGQPMLTGQIEDQSGSIGIVVFPKSYPEVSHVFEEGNIVLIRGSVRARDRVNMSGESDAQVERSLIVNAAMLVPVPVAA
jgi:DNA polymerase-3 subunit alpha